MSYRKLSKIVLCWFRSLSLTFLLAGPMVSCNNTCSRMIVPKLCHSRCEKSFERWFSAWQMLHPEPNFSSLPSQTSRMIMCKKSRCTHSIQQNELLCSLTIMSTEHKHSNTQPQPSRHYNSPRYWQRIR
ncbi:hypothetical protein FB446DRAFT_493263 [Lentinula raphanica]|nr:hypothetical protein FB446DRAFT_493263 [Lentinula raphanica]